MPPENQIKHHNECGNLPKRVHKEVFIIPIMLNGRVSYQKHTSEALNRPRIDL